jgi:transcriptional regulator with GAF, ATPase, and Fis domain
MAVLAHTGGRPQQTNLRQLVEAYERRLIIEALVRAHGNQRRAAVELGCLPTTLNEKMRRLGLRTCDQRMMSEASAAEPELMGHA